MDLIHFKKPSVAFMIEALVGKQKLEPIRQVGFECLSIVENKSHSGGLAYMWRTGPLVNIQSFFYINIYMIISQSDGVRY